MYCQAPTQTWKGEPSTCDRTAHHTLGPLNLCWQHRDAVLADAAHALDFHRISQERDRLEQLVRRRRWREARRRLERNALISRVYFAVKRDAVPGDPEWGLVKIGRACDVERRMADLGSEAVATQLGHSTEEAALHRRFAHLRRHGEWFEPGPDLITYIMEVA